MITDKIEVKFLLNGREVSTEVAPLTPLIDILRDTFGLFGTKLGCGEGECGACTVLIGGKSVNSCLFLAVDADGCEVTTIEGLAKDSSLHPIQEAFVKTGAVQCGFCTPGMILQAKSILDSSSSELTESVIRREIEGNLCRCTGYDKIIKAIMAVDKGR